MKVGFSSANSSRAIRHPQPPAAAGNPMNGHAHFMPDGHVARVLARMMPWPLALLFVLVLAGCNMAPYQMPLPLVTTEQTEPFTAVPLNRAWVNLPSAVVVIERGLRDSKEQRIGLPNTSTVPGDNSVLLRARKPEGSDAGRFNFPEFMARVGTVPPPFGKVVAGDLRTGEDAMGPYFWAEDRKPDGTICVLALRRMTTGMRQLPRNYTVLDVMMRNCVSAPLDVALRPITAPHIGFAYGVAAPTPGGASRMLSPLAGPTPR